MSLLIANDAVVLYPAGGDDEHGWRLPDAEPAWEGTGNLQLGPGASDPGAGDGGGAGPFAPAAAEAGQLFLPPDAGAADGMTAEIRGRLFVLSQVRLITDPRGSGELDCQQASVSAVSGWPGEM